MDPISKLKNKYLDWSICSESNDNIEIIEKGRPLSPNSKKEKIDNIFAKITQLLQKKRIKSVLNALEENEQILSSNTENFFIYITMKFRLEFMRLEKKLEILNLMSLKIVKEINKNSKQKLIAYLNRSFNDLELSIKKLFAKMEKKQFDEEDKKKYKKKGFKEKMLQIYCQLTLLKARYLRMQDFFQDSMALLSMAYKMLDDFIDRKIIVEDYTLSIFSQIMLNISTLLIEDNSFQSAIGICQKNLKLSFKEIYLSLKGKSIYDMDGFKEKKGKKLHEIIKACERITITFLQIGICHENIGLPNSADLAIESYKGANWFAFEFLEEYNPKLCQFCKMTIEDIIKRREKNNEKSKKALLEGNKNLNDKKEKEEKDNFNKFITSRSDNQLAKMEKLGKSLNSIKIPNEAITKNTLLRGEYNTTGNKIKPEKDMLTTFNLYNDLMSDDYKNFINSTKYNQLANLNEETKNKLEKYSVVLVLNEKEAEEARKQKEKEEQEKAEKELKEKEAKEKEEKEKEKILKEQIQKEIKSREASKKNIRKLDNNFPTIDLFKNSKTFQEIEKLKFNLKKTEPETTKNTFFYNPYFSKPKSKFNNALDPTKEPLKTDRKEEEIAIKAPIMEYKNEIKTSRQNDYLKFKQRPMSSTMSSRYNFKKRKENSNNSFGLKNKKEILTSTGNNTNIPTINTTSNFYIPTEASKIRPQSSNYNRLQSRLYSAQTAQTQVANKTKINKEFFRQQLKKYNEIPKYEVKNKYIYSKDYHKKLGYMKRMTDRNIELQKKILDKKNCEAKNYIYSEEDKFDEYQLKREVEIDFTLLKDKATLKKKEKKKVIEEIKSEDEIEIENCEKTKQKLLNSIIISLDPRVFAKVEKTENKRKEALQKLYLKNSNNPNIEEIKALWDKNVCKNKNNKILNFIGRDLDHLNKKEENMVHNYNENK